MHYGKVLQLCGCLSSAFLTMVILSGNVDKCSAHIWKTARLWKAEYKYGLSNHKEEPLFKTDVTGVFLTDTLIHTFFSVQIVSKHKMLFPPPQPKEKEEREGKETQAHCHITTTGIVYFSYSLGWLAQQTAPTYNAP